jgi:acetyl-CoA carboxylase biotin carboxyl carrier protein
VLGDGRTGLAAQPGLREDDMAEEVLAPLAGKVLSVAVEVGATVEEDDELLVLEAMKMETVVYAPADGTVSAIQAVVGQQVEEDDQLMTID